MALDSTPTELLIKYVIEIFRNIFGTGDTLLRRFRTLLFLAVLALTPLRAALLAHIDGDSSVPGVWSYTVFNDEMPGSPQYIAQFFVLVGAPITVTGTADGWIVTTDYLSYVEWTSADATPPYPHDIAPGSSLGGFQISSPGALSTASIGSAQAWDHALDVAGATSDALLVDAPVTVPEPGPAFLAPLLLLAWRYRRGLRARSS